jgi:hypothetical protein
VAWNRWQKFRYRLRYHYWQIVRRINVKKYLQHEIDNDPEGEADGPILSQDLMCIESDEYMKRARHVHVSIYDLPLPENSGTYWKQAYDGLHYLEYYTLTKFKRLVEDAEYERNKRRREGKEHWIKWITVIASTIAAIASLYVALFKK